MNQQIVSQIEDEFFGYNDSAIFRLTNGQVWQQSRYKYLYHYSYRPHVRITVGPFGTFIMEVDGVNESVEVAQVQLVLGGKIVSDFTGHQYGAMFEFHNGQVWQQIENKYRYHYAYSPTGYIVDGLNGLQLFVDGLDDAVRVRRTR